LSRQVPKRSSPLVVMAARTPARRRFPRHDIHPAQAAEQRHHGAAVLGHGQHRRFFALFQQQRRQGADHDTGRTGR
jgi:hypothetical protein